MKNLLNLGKALNKAEQKKVFGGRVEAIDRCGSRCAHHASRPCCRQCRDGFFCKIKVPSGG